ncbi:MAG: hypothetical protein IJV65_04255 [Kiritimatiellae bacterium]|nr:hypothetical protein [Kiritimatiellia bacterium]
MKFDKFGKAYHLSLETPADLRDALAVDDSFWAVTSAPAAAFDEDPAFLKYLDADGNGRIRSDEVRAALRWLLERLADDAKVGAPADEMPVASVSAADDAGKAIHTTVAYVNEQAGRNDGLVRLADVREAMASLRAKPLNGDGVLVPDAADTPELKAWIEAAVAATGGTPDISGKQGVTSGQIAAFKDAVRDFLEWKGRGAPDNAETMPLGADTPAVWDLCARHAEAIDRFFFLADFERFDPERAAKFLVAKPDTETAAAALDAAPLARPAPDGSLPLDGALVNPARRADVAALRNGLFGRVLGTKDPAAATEADWKKVKAVLAPYGAYLASKKGAIAESQPADMLPAWDKGDFAERAAKLQEEDKVVAQRVAAFSDLEKLLLYHRRLPRFLNNYVALKQLYDPKQTALFEKGRLLIDGRWFNLAIRIPDPAAHAAVAKNGGLYTMYLKIEPHDAAGETYTVVVPATAGTRGNLAVGKRGVFFDLQGRECDATVVSIVENPISLKEAILSPFQNIAKSVLGKIEGMGAAASSKIEAAGTAAAGDALDGKAPAAPAPAPAPAAGGGAGGLFMTASIAIAALGSAFAFLAKSVSEMSWTSRIVTLVVLLAVVFGPIVLAGVLKLMRQDLGPIIEGCGWAVNKSMRLTRRLRRQFTLRLPYPKEADGTPCKRFVAGLLTLLVAAALVVCVVFGIRSARAPAAGEPAPTVEEAVQDAAAGAADAVADTASGAVDAAADAAAEVADAAADAAPAPAAAE